MGMRYIPQCRCNLPGIFTRKAPKLAKKALRIGDLVIEEAVLNLPIGHAHSCGILVEALLGTV